MHKLIHWRNSKRRKPLILKGVRQTGKTYLLSEFGRQEFRDTHIINFEKQGDLHRLFEENLDPERIIDDLRFALKRNIDINNDVVIFDEIQACPKAITSLKYFCEDLPQLALCSAGSLLGLHLNESSFPVGKVDMMHLFPMTFSEFLAGIDAIEAAELIMQFDKHSRISATKHDTLWQYLRYYFVTGGMPEAVDIFRELQDNLYEACIAVRDKQDQLIKAYYADIAKHAGKVNAMHIDRTWRAIPRQLESNYDTNTSRFKFKDIIPSINRYRQLVNVIDWLESAELLIKIPIVAAHQQPLEAYSKDNTFKLMMFDIGILGAMSQLDPVTLLKNNFGTYKGYFAENFVAQQLTALNANLYSWQENRNEVEFLFPKSGKIVPIEVKSGKQTRAKSLRYYIDQYQPATSIIFSANQPHTNSQGNVIHLPLYLTEYLGLLSVED